MAVVPLEDECLWYIIVNIQDFSPEFLSLLPQFVRYRLLLNLPVVDVCQLESTCVMEGIDTEKLWESLCSNRLRLKVGVLPSLPHGMEGFSWKEKYFNAVLNSLFHEPFVAGCGYAYARRAATMYREFVDMLFSVPNPLGLDPACGLSLTQSNYHSLNLVPRVLRLDADMLNIFEICHFRPRYLFVHAATRTDLEMKYLQMESARFAHFMSNVQFLQFAEGYRYFSRRRHTRLKEMTSGNFIPVLTLFLGSVAANAQNMLCALHLDLSKAQFSVDSHTLTEDIVPALTIDLHKQLNSIQYISLKAPSDVDLSNNGVNVQSFFDVVFSLPQLSTLELGVGLTPQHVELLLSSWKRFCGGRKLKKLSLRLTIGNDPTKARCYSLLSEICSEADVVDTIRTD